LLVTVLYNSEPVLAEWLSGVRGLCADSDHQVYASVVDNASADDTVARLRDSLTTLDPIRLTAHPQNAGWGGGNNVGLRAYDEPEMASFDAVVFLNPDVILPAAALDSMCHALAEDPAAGAVVPRMVDGQGASRVPAFPHFTLADSLLGLLGWRGRRVSRWQRPRNNGTIDDLDGGYAEGSCVMVRQTALRDAGPFDETFFMYFDDTDLTRRLTAAGYGLRYLPDASAIDLPGKGSRARIDNDENRLDRYVYYLASELRYYKKWHGQQTARWLARFKLWCDLPARTVIWRIRHGSRRVWQACRGVIRQFLASEVQTS